MSFLRQFFLILILLSVNLLAQGDLEVFGFYQVRLDRNSNNINMTGKIPTPLGILNKDLFVQKQDYFSSTMQQADIFLRKELTGSFKSDEKTADLKLFLEGGSIAPSNPRWVYL